MKHKGGTAMREKIYLSGAVEKTDDPDVWRRKLRVKFGYYSFYDPMVEDKELYEDGKHYEMCFKQLRQIALSDFLLINYEPGIETWGTPMEAMWAYMSQTPVIVWSDEDISELPVYLKVFSDYVNESAENCLRVGERLS